MTNIAVENQSNPGPIRPAPENRALSKDEINALPLHRYEGPLFLVKTGAELKQAVRKLKSQRLLGFDTETQPSFKKGTSHKPSLVQLAADDGVYLFHLGHLPLNDGLLRIFVNPAIIKAGVSTSRDLSELRELQPFEPKNFVNLEDKARALGFKNQGLRGMAAAVLGYRISKQAQTSNWSRKNLTRTQLVYAATDAWISRELYKALEKLEHRRSSRSRVPPAKKDP